MYFPRYREKARTHHEGEENGGLLERLDDPQHDQTRQLDGRKDVDALQGHLQTKTSSQTPSSDHKGFARDKEGS